MKKHDWTLWQDATIRTMRADGNGWDAIAIAVGVCRWTTAQRGRELGCAHVKPPHPFQVPDTPNDPPPRDNRFWEALPPGHPDTWGVIVRGSVLDGVEYQYVPPRVARREARP